ncbi:unnamed protein product [Victoria cruziana]
MSSGVTGLRKKMLHYGSSILLPASIARLPANKKNNSNTVHTRDGNKNQTHRKGGKSPAAMQDPLQLVRKILQRFGQCKTHRTDRDGGERGRKMEAGNQAWKKKR